MDTRTIGDALAALDRIAPPYLALGSDPRGLLIGDPQAPLTGILACLDVTSGSVEAAQRAGASLIVAHHPLIFHPAKTLRADEPHPGKVALACARAGIAVACAHTNWDVAPGGINDVLATLLGITDAKPLRTTWCEGLVKIVVFVPTEHRDAVFAAMSELGAGALGNYDRCGFWSQGTGTFRPLAGANPTIGSIGQSAFVTEDRLEVLVPEARFPAVVSAMKAAHPYEEVAYEVYPLKNGGASHGIGRIGRLTEARQYNDFLTHVEKALGTVPRTLTPASEATIQRVAVCGGAGAELMDTAIAQGADALITGDIRHHELVAAAEQGFLLVDAGHFATENPGAQELGRRLAQELPGTGITFV